MGAVVLCLLGWMVAALFAGGVESQYRGRWYCVFIFQQPCERTIYVDFDGVQYSTVCTCVIIGFVQHVVDPSSYLQHVRRDTSCGNHQNPRCCVVFTLVQLFK